MQIRGVLSKSGTTNRIDAALLVAEPGQAAGTLYLARADASGVTQAGILNVTSSIGGSDTRLQLSTGDVFHLPAGTDIEMLKPFMPRSAWASSRLAALERVNWRGAIMLSFLFFGMIFAFRLAVAPLGDLATKFVPQHLVQTASGSILQQLDTAFLDPTTLDEEQQERIRADFQKIVALAPPEFADTRLHFRSSSMIGPNAFALPGNDVVLLDELVTFADDEDVVLGVLAHELGHVTSRHALRHIMRGTVVVVGVSLLVGAEDSILEEMIGFGGSIVLAGHSQNFELEADQQSAGWMRAIGRDPLALARFFQKIEKECEPYCGDGGFLSTHPAFKERIKVLAAE